MMQATRRETMTKAKTPPRFVSVNDAGQIEKHFFGNDLKLIKTPQGVCVLESFEEHFTFHVMSMQSGRTTWAVVYEQIDAPIRIEQGVINGWDLADLEKAYNKALDNLTKNWYPAFRPAT
jgi:hypothetical protein